MAAFLKEQQAKSGEVADNEQDNVFDGCNEIEAVVSACSLGLACAMMAAKSAQSGNMKGPDGVILCAGLE